MVRRGIHGRSRGGRRSSSRPPRTEVEGSEVREDFSMRTHGEGDGKNRSRWRRERWIREGGAWRLHSRSHQGGHHNLEPDGPKGLGGE